MTTIGWIGVGRMGFPMAERLLAAGNDLRIWNRTKSRAQPPADRGAKVVQEIGELADVDVLFTMVSTGDDLREVCFGPNGLFSKAQGNRPEILVDCSSIGVDESKAIRAELARRGTQYVVASVSGNGACVRAGKLSSVASGPKAAYDRV
jgi:3-hydroxyisobutyrate dehydrogenase